MGDESIVNISREKAVEFMMKNIPDSVVEDIVNSLLRTRGARIRVHIGLGDDDDKVSDKVL